MYKERERERDRTREHIKALVPINLSTRYLRCLRNTRIKRVVLIYPWIDDRLRMYVQGNLLADKLLRNCTDKHTA